MSQKKADVRGHQCRSDDPPRRRGRSHIPPVLLTSSPQLNSTYQFESSHSQAAAGSYGEPPINQLAARRAITHQIFISWGAGMVNTVHNRFLEPTHTLTRQEQG